MWGRNRVVLRNPTQTEEREVAADGVFVAIGHDPTTALFLDVLDHDEAGYLDREPARPRRTSRASSQPVTSRITSTDRR